MTPQSNAEQRIARVRATAPSFEHARRQENIATASRWTSIAFGARLAAQGGPVALAAYGAGVASGFAGSWVAEKTGAPELAAKAFEFVGMHRMAQGKSQAATINHKVAHSYGFAGLIAGLVVGAVAALAAGALVVATGGAAAVVFVGAAAAGGFAGGFLGTMVAGGLAKMGAVAGCIATGSPNTFIGGLPVARMTDTAACIKEPAPSPLVEGSETIFVNGLPMVRVGHKTACGAAVDEGFHNVFLDHTTTACAAADSDVPLWARITADWIVFLRWGKAPRGYRDEALKEKVKQETAIEIEKGNNGVAYSRAMAGWRISKPFTNLAVYVKGFPGILILKGGKQFIITDEQAFMTGLRRAYADSGHPLTDRMSGQIEQHIAGGGPFDRAAGVPGAHAEVRAVNDIYTDDPDVEDGDVTAATNKLGETSGGGQQGSAFPACPNCSGILPDANIPTGRR